MDIFLFVIIVIAFDSFHYGSTITNKNIQNIYCHKTHEKPTQKKLKASFNNINYFMKSETLKK